MKHGFLIVIIAVLVFGGCDNNYFHDLLQMAGIGDPGIVDPGPVGPGPVGPGPVDPVYTITIAAIPGVTPPVFEAIPVTSITETDQYTGTVTWLPDVSGTFALDTVYTATITLTAKARYTLQGVAADFFTVAGADTVTNDANSGVVTAVFPPTGEVTVTLTSIPVTPPESFDEPVTTVTTAQYTGTVEWDPELGDWFGWYWGKKVFSPDEEYGAFITLTANDGYTFSGVDLDSFTVAGAEEVLAGTVSDMVIGVSAKFPPTNKEVDHNITGIKPEGGKTPATSVNATDSYTGTVTWSPAVSTFEPGIYTATITLTVKPGYAQRVPANWFEVAGAIGQPTNSENSFVVTAVFRTLTRAELLAEYLNKGEWWPHIGSLSATAEGDEVTVTGNVNNYATYWLQLDLAIPEGVTVLWQATFRNIFNGAWPQGGVINLSGSGTMEITGGEIANTQSACIQITGSPTLKISGGTFNGNVSTIQVKAGATPNIFISGGTFTSTATDVNNIELNGGGTITVTGTPSITTTGANSHNIHRDSGATVLGYYSNAANKAFFDSGWTDGVNLLPAP